MHIKWLFAFYLIAYNFSAMAVPTAFPTLKQQNQNWKQDINNRANELQNLQKQNGYGDERLTKTDFPKTYADVPFLQRIENEKAGLEPFKDLKAYQELNVKTAEEWCKEHSDDSLCKKEEPKKPEDPKQPEQPETTTVCKTKLGDLNVGQGFKKRPLSDCDGIEKTEPDTSIVKSWEIVCRDGGKTVCKPYECKDNKYKVDVKNGKCIKNCEIDLTDKDMGNHPKDVSVDCILDPNCLLAINGVSMSYSPNKKEWSVGFADGHTVHGLSMCLELPGKYATVASLADGKQYITEKVIKCLQDGNCDKALSNDHMLSSGSFCWCISEYSVGPVFLHDFCEKSACTADCSHACALFIKNDKLFRKGFFTDLKTYFDKQ